MVRDVEGTDARSDDRVDGQAGPDRGDGRPGGSPRVPGGVLLHEGPENVWFRDGHGILIKVLVWLKTLLFSPIFSVLSRVPFDFARH